MTPLFKGAKPVRWNVGSETYTPKDARDCKDHPAVRNTSYGEVHDLIGTNGCSYTPDLWTWCVMGVIEQSNRQRLIVNPGDWILEPVPGVFLVLTDEQFRSL